MGWKYEYMVGWNERGGKAYGQHSALLYLCDSGVPILYHESKSIPWVLSISWIYIYTMSPCQYHESMYLSWVLANNMTISWVNTMSPCLYNESISRGTQRFKRYVCDSGVPILYHESKSRPWVLSIILVFTLSPCQYHDIMYIPWVLVNSKRYLKVQKVPSGSRGT